MVVGYTAVRVLQFYFTVTRFGKFILNQMGEHCNNNNFNLDSKPLTESEYKYQLEKQHLIIESLQQEVSYLKEIIKLLRHGD